MTTRPPFRFFGRTGELDVLRQLTASVRSGHSAVLVMRGEAGIGKTELLRHLIDEASGFTVARCVGVESEMELPFAGLHQLCAPMLGRLYSLPEPQRHGLGVAFGLESGDSPDRFLVALAALGLLAEASEEAWYQLAIGQVRLARANGTLSWLPFALDYLAEINIQAGELPQAAALLAEGESIDPGIRAATLPYVSLMLAAWRGDAPTAAELTEAMALGASARGEGTALTYAEYARAVLHNGLGNYQLAAEAAERAVATDELIMSPWALYELAEAAARGDQQERATAAAERLSAIAAASGTDWARGAAARSRALVSEGSAAEEEYREAIELLGRTRMAAHLARARLSYGEWLRRENRRVDAREVLRPAYETFTAMGAEAFSERARRELAATGEKVRKRSEDAYTELTPQEEEIARLARDGRTNHEIGAQLFIGARTVEWHLRKVFAKLDIGSRRELAGALKRRQRRPDAPAALN